MRVGVVVALATLACSEPPPARASDAGAAPDVDVDAPTTAEGGGVTPASCTDQFCEGFETMDPPLAFRWQPYLPQPAPPVFRTSPDPLVFASGMRSLKIEWAPSANDPGGLWTTKAHFGRTSAAVALEVSFKMRVDAWSRSFTFVRFESSEAALELRYANGKLAPNPGGTFDAVKPTPGEFHTYRFVMTSPGPYSLVDVFVDSENEIGNVQIAGELVSSVTLSIGVTWGAGETTPQTVWFDDVRVK